MARLDLDQVIDKIDINAIVAKVDLDQVLDKVDVNSIVERVDIDGLVQRTELGSLVAQAGAGVATEALDAVRSVGVGMDGFVHGIVDRLFGRRDKPMPAGPPLLVGADVPVAS